MRNIDVETPARTRLRKPSQGFSYVEVLIATAILALALIPVMDALHSAVRSSGAQSEIAGRGRFLQSLFEEVLAQRFTDLDAAGLAAGSPTVATTYSDAVAAVPRRIIYISRYDIDNADGDGNPFTGVDSDVLWIRGEIPNSVFSFETLTTP